ncbi:Ribose methyltransferase [Aphanomyces cochlioides]|nr:Ribose methyltransferase [Aphanomyces cochlioides]
MLRRTFATGGWGGAGRSEFGRSWKKSSAPSNGRGWKDRDAKRSPPKLSEFKQEKSSVENVPGETLHGIHGVRQALRCNLRVFHRLMLRDTNGQPATNKDVKKSDEQNLVKEIKRLASDLAIPITYESKWTLNHVTDDKPHQGVVLFADPIDIPHFEPHEPPSSDGRPPVILALDELHDAQNFGAVLRSAYFLGVHAVLTSTRNNAPLSAAVLRASVGSSEVLAHERRLFETPNMHQALAMSRQLGWNIVGACSGAKAVSLSTYSITKPTILVVGNEHRGLNSAIRRCCDDILTIPGVEQDEASKVDSLNVSVATGILLYQLLHINIK